MWSEECCSDIYCLADVGDADLHIGSANFTGTNTQHRNPSGLGTREKLTFPEHFFLFTVVISPLTH